MKFLHLSDLHFHRNREDNKEIEATLNSINDKYPNHSIIVTGDIVDDGHEQQYENALKQLEKFQNRIYISPGNHDFGAAGNFYSHERAKRFDEMLSIPLKQGGTFFSENKPVVNIVEEGNDKIMLIALDTNLETHHPFDFACGEIGENQLTALSIILDSKPQGMETILFFHHHPFMHNNPFMELKDAKDLIQTIYSKVDIILFGHKHEMKKWDNVWGTKYILASDNSPSKKKACEVTITNGKISMKYVNI
jgi:predicted phosphodiesterase